MAFNNLDVTNDCYLLYVDNKEKENELTENVHSSAGEFNVLIEPQLDLASMLFLKSTEGEISLQNWHIDGLPLSASRLEQCFVQVQIDDQVTFANWVYTCASQKEFNEVMHPLPMTDHHCRSPSEVIDYFNSVMANKVNQLIIGSYLRAFLDADIWKFRTDGIMTLDDIKLASRYLDIGFECRRILHKHLCKMIICSPCILIKSGIRK